MASPRSCALLLALGALPSPAQAPPPPAAPAAAPAPPVTFRASLWTGFAASNRSLDDGSLFLRPVERGDGAFSVEGASVGVDVALAKGWSLKVTALGGRAGEVLNLTSAESGTVGIPEAQLVWTGAADTVHLGRMYTLLGMEFLEGTSNITASRGLLFTYAIPIGQVGLHWRHAFNADWSSDLWALNGEDRVKDNNHGKTYGAGVNYSPGGSAEKAIALSVYQGPEGDALGAAAGSGAEGRKRTRMELCFLWTWGDFALTGEFDAASEDLAPGTLPDAGPREQVKATWTGAGLIGKLKLSPDWSLFGRVETFSDSTGIRLAGDPAVAGRGLSKHADLRATSLTLGLERTWGPTYGRVEVRQDSLDKEVAEGAGKGRFKNATSLSLQWGARF